MGKRIEIDADDRAIIVEARNILDGRSRARFHREFARRLAIAADHVLTTIDREAQIVRRAELDLDGWRYGRPDRRGVIDGAQIDADTAAASECPVCGQHGLTFVSMVRNEDTGDGRGTYRAIAECPSCQNAFDF